MKFLLESYIWPIFRLLKQIADLRVKLEEAKNELRAERKQYSLSTFGGKVLQDDLEFVKDELKTVQMRLADAPLAGDGFGAGRGATGSSSLQLLSADLGVQVSDLYDEIDRVKQRMGAVSTVFDFDQSQGLMGVSEYGAGGAGRDTNAAAAGSLRMNGGPISEKQEGELMSKLELYVRWGILP